MIRNIKIFIIGFCVINSLMSCTRKVKIYECIDCKVITEKGTYLDAKVYKRKSSLTNNEGNIFTDEYTLVFGNSINDIKISGRPFENPKYLLFYPEFTIVAIPNYPVEQYENYITHKDIQEASFTILKADTSDVYIPGIAIHKIEYSPTQIKFNSFGKLKKHGTSIILKYE